MKMIILSSLLLLASCGSVSVKKEDISKIKRIAIVTYSVPTKIEFKEDPRKTDNSVSLMDLV
jgi:hypothetical protein